MSTVTKNVLAIHTLRVNIKSLAAESRFIRQETARCGREYKNALALHRRGKVREEARYSHLALGFLRGRKYRQLEHKTGKKVDAKRIAAKLNKHDWQLMIQPAAIEKWLAE